MRVWGLEFRVQGLGFRVQGFRVQGLGFRVRGVEFRLDLAIFLVHLSRRVLRVEGCASRLSRPPHTLRVLVFSVIYHSGWVSLENRLLSIIGDI